MKESSVYYTFSFSLGFSLLYLQNKKICWTTLMLPVLTQPLYFFTLRKCIIMRQQMVSPCVWDIHPQKNLSVQENKPLLEIHSSLLQEGAYKRLKVFTLTMITHRLSYVVPHSCSALFLLRHASALCQNSIPQFGTVQNRMDKNIQRNSTYSWLLQVLWLTCFKAEEVCFFK